MIKHICRLHLNCLLSAVILMLMVPFLTGFDISQQVTILYDGQTKEAVSYTHLTLPTTARV